MALCVSFWCHVLYFIWTNNIIIIIQLSQLLSQFVMCISIHNFVLCNLAVFLYFAIETINLT